MANLALEDLASLRFTWPEPLLIDLIIECYDGAPADRLTPARLHARFLHALFDGKIRPAAALRVELIGCCAARAITPEAIETADQTALLELMRVIRTRFRNSPRACLHRMQQLHAAIERLPKRHPHRAAAVRSPVDTGIGPFASAA